MPSERTDAVIKSNLEPSWRLLLIVIASHMKPDQLLTWTKPETLARETGLAKSTVMEILWAMEDVGIITRTDDEHKSKTIRIVWPLLATYTPTKSKRGGNQRKRTEDRSQDTGNRYDGTEHRYADTGNRPVDTEDRYPAYRTPVSGVPIIGPEQEREQETEPVMEQERIHVPPVPVATSSLTTPEPPACAPPQAIPTSALESTARDATNTQPGLFGQATAATVDSPKKPKKAAAKVDNAEAVGKVWATYRKHHPLCRETIPVSDGKMVAAALKDWSAEQLCRMVDWAHTSKHERALFLQDGGYLGIDNLFRAGKIAARVELAEAEAGPVTRPHPTPDGVVFGRLEEPKKEKISALPPNLGKAGVVDVAGSIWNRARNRRDDVLNQEVVNGNG